MPSYKLVYFDGRGRAELSRLLFALAGQEYEDYRFPHADMPNYKSTVPFGQFPVLEIDGKQYAQSIAIATYLAREFGYYGNTNEEALQIDQVVNLVCDFFNVCRNVWRESDDSKRAQLVDTLQETEIPKFMEFFEKLLKANGTGYFVGDSPTLADLAVYNIVNNVPNRLPGVSLLDKSPEVRDLNERVGNLERIKAYVANRKPTPL